MGLPERRTRRTAQGILKLVEERPIWLWIALTAVPVSQIIQTATGGRAYLGFQPSSVVAFLALATLTLILAVPFRPTQEWGRISSGALALLIAVAVLQLLFTQIHGELFALSALMTPPLLAALLFKPPSRKDALIGVQLVAIGFVLIAGIWLFLDFFGLVSSGFQVQRTGLSRLPIIQEFINARWEGPFGNVNYAGPVGAFVLFIGLVSHRSMRVALIIGGGCILLLSQSRTAILGLACAIAVVALFGYKNGHFRFRLATRIGVILAVVASIGAYIYRFDPTLGLRTDVWRDFLILWSSKPLSGVGDSGIQSYMEGPRMFAEYPPSHAHNVLLDTASRDGLVVALCALTAIVVLGIAAYSALPRVGSGPLGLWTLVVSMSLTETTFNFIDFNQLYIALVAILLLAGPGSEHAKGDASLRGEPQHNGVLGGMSLKSGSEACQS